MRSLSEIARQFGNCSSQCCQKTVRPGFTAPNKACAYQAWNCAPANTLALSTHEFRKDLRERERGALATKGNVRKCPAYNLPKRGSICFVSLSLSLSLSRTLSAFDSFSFCVAICTPRRFEQRHSMWKFPWKRKLLSKEIFSQTSLEVCLGLTNPKKRFVTKGVSFYQPFANLPVPLEVIRSYSSSALLLLHCANVSCKNLSQGMATIVMHQTNVVACWPATACDTAFPPLFVLNFDTKVSYLDMEQQKSCLVH